MSDAPKWEDVSDWSGLPEVYLTKVQRQQGMFWRVEACSVPMAIGPEVPLVVRHPAVLAELPEVKAMFAAAVEGAANNKEQLEIWAHEIVVGLGFADVLKITSYDDNIEAHDTVGRELVEIIRASIPADAKAALDAYVAGKVREALREASDEVLLRELVRRNPPSKAPRSRTMHDQDCLIGIGKANHCYITFQDEDLSALIEEDKP